jgi:hypothetical protein
MFPGSSIEFEGSRLLVASENDSNGPDTLSILDSAESPGNGRQAAVGSANFCRRASVARYLSDRFVITHAEICDQHGTGAFQSRREGVTPSFNHRSQYLKERQSSALIKRRFQGRTGFRTERWRVK